MHEKGSTGIVRNVQKYPSSELTNIKRLNTKQNQNLLFLRIFDLSWLFLNTMMLHKE